MLLADAILRLVKRSPKSVACKVVKHTTGKHRVLKQQGAAKNINLVTAVKSARNIQSLPRNR